MRNACAAVSDVPVGFCSTELITSIFGRQVWTIVLQLSGPIIGTLAIMQFINSWNDIMLPLILLRDKELLTVSVGLLRLDGEYVKEYGKLMAGYAISSIPLIVLFLFTMRMFVKGLTAGAVKG